MDDKLTTMTMTAAQAITLHHHWMTWKAGGSADCPETFDAFIGQCQPAFGGDCIMFPYCHMVVGVERDGYKHT